MKIYKFISILTLVALIGCTSTSEKVLFSSGRNGNSDIFVMNAKGKIINQITEEDSEEWSPVWVNDSEISYLSQLGEDIFIYKHNVETGESSRIDHPINCQLDDKNMVYSRSSDKRIYGCKGEVFLIDNTTDSTINLTVGLPGNANYIGWGKLDNEVIFTSNHEGNNDIYLLDLKSGNLENITNHPANDERGDISPDGVFMVFSSDRYEEGNQDIVMQNLQTKETVRVTESKGTELIARWSSDQQKIYFGSNKDGNWELYSYQLKNKRIKRLTKDSNFDGDPRVR